VASIPQECELPDQHSTGVQSVERAIAILKSFSLERPEWGVGELSRELGLHKSTVSRLVTTLERGGLLARSPETRRYRLGIDLIGLAAQVVSYLDVREVARPLLRQLATDCQESVNLVVLESPSPSHQHAWQVVNLEQFIPPARQVKNIGRVGRRMCAHCTAAGKTLLAHLSPEELARTLSSELERYTPHTITDPRQLRLELEQVRQQGYAIALEELEEGLHAVAAPIHDHTGQVIAAASIAGPAYRVTSEHLPHLAAHLTEATRDISVRLGYKK
jgi:DNA-binding IclR family transcriptional regulator